MLKHDYTYEAKYVRIIRNWRRACDERGLSSIQRCKFNYEMLQFILDDLMRSSMILACWKLIGMSDFITNTLN